MKKSKMMRLNSGEFWAPTEKGETFSGKITGRRVIDTKFGARPVLEFTNEETGEITELITGNLRLRPLNRVPLGTYVELEYAGEETLQIGKRKQVVPVIYASIPVGTKLGEDWTLDKLDKPGSKSRTKPKSKKGR